MKNTWDLFYLFFCSFRSVKEFEWVSSYKKFCFVPFICMLSDKKALKMFDPRIWCAKNLLGYRVAHHWEVLSRTGIETSVGDIFITSIEFSTTALDSLYLIMNTFLLFYFMLETSCVLNLTLKRKSKHIQLCLLFKIFIKCKT